MTEVIKKEKGPIDDVINEDAFEIHGIMFKNKDIIQCVFLSSKSLYEYYNSPACNCFAITVNTEENFVVATPMLMNTEYNDCVLRNDKESSPQSEIENMRNTYTKHKGKYTMMFLTKGYIMDHFTVQDSYHDFLVNEDDSHVVISAKDIESITHKNPYLV